MTKKKTPKKKKGKNRLGINYSNFKIVWNRNIFQKEFQKFQITAPIFYSSVDLLSYFLHLQVN